jgi:Fe-S-cluster containining protein
MVGESERYSRLIGEVAALYDWIDAQLREHGDLAGPCQACGDCCDFVGYDHLLFVTPPELIYLAEKLKATSLRKMDSGRCPYQDGTKCSIHPYRFSGCRIFCCSGDSDFQSRLTEAALKKLKALCERFGLSYRYADLAKALAAFSSSLDTCRPAAEPFPDPRAG